MDLLLPLLAVCVCCVCVYVYGKLTPWLRIIKIAKNVPTLSGGLPLIGHVHKLLTSDYELLKYIDEASKEVDELGGVAKMWLGPFPFFILVDPDEALKVGNVCVHKNYVYKFGSTWVGEGLVISSSTVWKRHRKLLTPSFNKQILDGFIPIFNLQSRELVKRLGTNVGDGQFVITPYVMNMALNTICQTAFGYNVGAEINVEESFRQAVEKMMDIIMKRFKTTWMHIDCLYKLSGLWKLELETVDILHKFTSLVYNNAKVKFETKENISDSKFKAFLDLMLQQQSEGSLTGEEVRDELNSMIVAGHETSSTEMIFIFTLLGLHPAIQDRVYEELKEVLGDSDRDIIKDDLPKLVYMEAVIKETLRLYPVVSFQIRVIDRDVKLSHYILPKGGFASINIWGINRSKIWGDDAATFRPDRWFDSTLPSNSDAFASFGIGKRACIGKQYAIMNLKIVLAQVLRKFRLKSKEKVLNVKLSVLLKPAFDCLISIEPRSNLI